MRPRTLADVNFREQAQAARAASLGSSDPPTEPYQYNRFECCLQDNLIRGPRSDRKNVGIAKFLYGAKILHHLHILHNLLQLWLLELVTVFASRFKGEHIVVVT